METMLTGLGIVILTMLSYMVGFLLPPILRIVNKDIVNDDERVIMTYVVCFLVAMIISWQSFSSGNLVQMGTWFLLVSVQAQAAFKLYFKPKWDAQELPDNSMVGK